MINANSLKLHPFSYPILKTETLIESKIYEQLKKNWPDFTKFKTTSAGQVSRNNLELKKANNNYNKIHPLFKNLYDELDSKEFRDFLKNKFDLDKAQKEQGFVGDFDNSELVMHIAESKDGYENPWHVDTLGLPHPSGHHRHGQSPRLYAPWRGRSDRLPRNTSTLPEPPG